MEGGSQHWNQEAIVDVADKLRADQGVGHLREKDTGLNLGSSLKPSSSVYILHSKWKPQFGPCFHSLNNTQTP